MSFIDRPWREDKVAYLVRRSTDPASIERARHFVDHELEYLPLRRLVVSHLETEQKLREEVFVDLSSRDPDFGARFVITPNSFALICNHAIGDASFMFPLVSILAGAMGVESPDGRVRVLDATRSCFRQVLKQPILMMYTVSKVAASRRRRANGIQQATDQVVRGWAHEHTSIAPEVVKGWRKNRLDGESGASSVMRHVLQCLDSIAQFPLSTRLSIMVDLRRYDERLLRRAGNFVGAVHLPLALAVSDDPGFGIRMRKQLDSSQPLVASMLATLRSNLPKSARRTALASSADGRAAIHISYTSKSALSDGERSGLEVFTIPAANTMSIRIAVDARGGASVSINSAYRPAELSYWVNRLDNLVG